MGKRCARTTARYFDHEIRLDAAKLPPIVDPGHLARGRGVDTGMVPDPDKIEDEAKTAVETSRAELHGLKAGTKSPTSSSTAFSSAPAPMAGSRICARRPRW